LGGSRRSPGSGGARSSYRQTKASVAAYERELRAAEREADIDKVAALEKALVGVHQHSFPKAAPVELPAPGGVDPEPIKRELEAEAAIPALAAEVGGGDAPPVAADPEPVDRYELMRAFRKRRRKGIPIWRVRDQIEAARAADEEAEAAAEAEAAQRKAMQAAEQARLDALWAQLEKGRATVADQLVLKVTAEKQRRDAERAADQAELDADWAKLQANDPDATIEALEAAFADNESPAAPLNCEGDRTTVVMQFASPEAIVPERKPSRTPTGKRTLKKRTKTEINALYVEALGSNVLATVKEAFAVAPGTQVVQMLVIRRETDKKHAGGLAAIYLGEFGRGSYDGDASGSGQPGNALTLASEAVLNLKGKTQQVTPIDLSVRPDLREVLGQVESGLKA
jgi:hypothetical protein